ncbi:MAG: hypothetical protein PHE25_04640 [Candidatus Gracilibacteria bacterium]|nr:hypothetical protein [Candidatus Gracilibacteria bacterium]
MLKIGDKFNGEIIENIIKKHCIINIFLIILLIIGGFLIIFAKNYFENIFLDLGIILYIQFCFLVFYTFFINFILDKIIITKSKIILIKKINIFNRKFIELNKNDIKEIKATSIGFLPNIFNYGKLILKHKDNYEINYLSDIINLVKQILKN